MRGLRSYGKTFHKIRKECLPERETVSPSLFVDYFLVHNEEETSIFLSDNIRF